MGGVSAPRLFSWMKDRGLSTMYVSRGRSSLVIDARAVFSEGQSQCGSKQDSVYSRDHYHHNNLWFMSVKMEDDRSPVMSLINHP